MSEPTDTDDWGNGKTLGEMRRICPDPRLTAHERNDPIELAAIDAGLNSWDAWGVYDGNYYDGDSYLHVRPMTGNGGFEISWSGQSDAFDRFEAVAALREFASALLKVTSKSPTGTSSTTTVVKEITYDAS